MIEEKQTTEEKKTTEESNDDADADIDIDKLINEKLAQQGKLQVELPKNIEAATVESTVAQSKPNAESKIKNDDDALLKMSPKELMELQKKIDKVLNAPIK